MEKQNELKYLYALSYVDPKDNELYTFYIGKTNNLKRRESEHRIAAKHGSEDKYVFIRDVLETNNIEWGLHSLKEEPINKYVEDWERWYVIDYIRSGQPIQNMKHGDLDSIKELSEQLGDETILYVEDVIRDRLRREKQKKELAFKKSEKLRKRVLEMDSLSDEQKDAIEREKKMDLLLDYIKKKMKLKKSFTSELKKPGWVKGCKTIEGITFHRFRQGEVYKLQYNDNTVSGDSYGECYSFIADRAVGEQLDG